MVQRLRIRYAKRGRLRFTSHRDFSRAFERAVFRSRLPMAYSSGFNPHPRISYAGAAPTGAASEAEYLEIALREPVDPDRARDRLAESLPDGLDILAVVAATGDSLADRLVVSRWQADLVVSAEEAQPLVDRFLAEPSVLVERMTKKGIRRFDARAAVLDLTVRAVGRGATVEMVLRHEGVPMVRPGDVLSGIAAQADGPGLGTPRLLTRLAQGELDSSGAVIEPF